MICHDYKCIFFHIPKNAGQSVEHVFLKLLGLTWETRAPLLLRPNPTPELGPPHLAHLLGREYVGHRYISQDLFDQYFKFAFVRNPWDRMVSMYKWHAFHKICSFNQFVTREFPRDLWKKKHWFVCPQTDYICDANGEVLADYVGRYENLAADFHYVCTQIGLPPLDLPHANSNRLGKNRAHTTLRWEARKVLSYPWWVLKGRKSVPTGKYRAYYTDEARELVGEYYKSDIEMFGYSF